MNNICANCLRGKLVRIYNMVNVECEIDNSIHLGKMFCDNRIDKNEIHERAERIREFVRIASDEILVKAMSK